MKLVLRSLLLAITIASLQTLHGGEALPFHPVTCEGVYPRHVQGICSNERDAIYWSWTDALVKTDVNGHLLKQVSVASHHGDLCFHEGRVYVAVNLGKFNEPAGKADSWVYVYDGETLAELSRHAVPEVVHGAGGMAWRDGKFFIIGGLPPEVDENYIYEYDGDFKFVKRHVLASGHTLMGIQTVAFDGTSWWFGCYGKPKVLLRADASFKFNGKWEFDGSYGIVPLADHTFLIGRNSGTKDRKNRGELVSAHEDPAKGLIIDASANKEK